MTAIYVFGGIIVLSIITLMLLRRKWGRASDMEVKLREANIEKERKEEAARRIAPQAK